MSSTMIAPARDGSVREDDAAAAPRARAAGSTPAPMGAPARGSAARVPLVVFALGEDLFGVSVGQVERVLKYRAPAPVPNMPPWLLGVLDHRGAVMPVLDLRARFELAPAAPDVERRVMVFAGDGGHVAAVVDRVLDVRHVEERALEPPPPLVRGLAREYVRAVLRRDGQAVIVLDAPRLLGATERLALLPDA